MTEAVSLPVLPAGPLFAADLLALPADVVTVGTRAPATREQPRDRVAWSPEDIVDEWGAGSFPASDPPANW